MTLSRQVVRGGSISKLGGGVSKARGNSRESWRTEQTGERSDEKKRDPPSIPD